MPTITFDLPEGALSALKLSQAEFVKEMRVAARLWDSRGELSQSKAAEVAGHKSVEPGLESNRRICFGVVDLVPLASSIAADGGESSRR